MKRQNQIKGTLSQSESIEQIQNYLDRQEHRGRTQLAKALCEHFSFYDPNVVDGVKPGLFAAVVK